LSIDNLSAALRVESSSLNLLEIVIIIPSAFSKLEISANLVLRSLNS